MNVHAEEFAIALQCKDVGVGIDAVLVQTVDAYEFVAHLVGGVGEHKDDFLASHRYAAEADGEAVAAEDGEDDADGASAGLGAYVLCNRADGCIIALRARDDGLGHADDVAVTDFEAFFLCGFQHTVGNYFCQIVALPDNGATDAAGHGPDSSFMDAHRMLYNRFSNILILPLNRNTSSAGLRLRPGGTCAGRARCCRCIWSCCSGACRRRWGCPGSASRARGRSSTRGV